MWPSEEAAALAGLRANPLGDDGWVLEIGPGGHPTPWDGPYESVDITAPGATGTAGSEAGVICTAMRQANMGDLPFPDEMFQGIVARHVLEHHPNTLGVLWEWNRVLHLDGVVSIICPDQGTYAGNTIHMDPTHQAAFTREQFGSLLHYAGFKVFRVEECLPQWSFVAHAVKITNARDYYRPRVS